ncbi:hypothetical protein GGI25_000608 [Coemansia spiralis]|uniref:SHSP domain-containing protein n=1 Tax=Coemansia spiralis TaxID=417178 RepID=A0A9W8GCK2_9FUNG|nr:hypothetical protein BX070DRAFT_228434 [Coemansia spiralis]KAJ2625508.1 hypothetical protein GGI26_000648 [Coemansia sp. RSA 1358]KAJ2680635.1 hypothetical protein GGI25_000608 [Coemansia spiralis]
MYTHKAKSATSLRDKGVVVVRMAPKTEIRHLFNGRVVDPKSNDPQCVHIHDCNWNPFAQLETSDFFCTFVEETPESYIIVVQMPSYISRYIRVQKNGRIMAIVGKAMAQRKWKDKGAVNVHEQWKVYWRLFRVPVQCSVGEIRTCYEKDRMVVVVPRRTKWMYRAADWVERRVSSSKITCG